MADLITLSDVKVALEMATPDANRDERVQGVISRVSAWFEGQVGRHLVRGLYDRNFDGNGKVALIFPEYPVSAVSLVSVDGRELLERAGLNGSGWVLVPDEFCAELRLVGACFSEGVQNVRVRWTAGYAPDAIPGDVQRAVLHMVALDLKETPFIGVQSASALGNSVSFLPSIIPQAVKDVIARYRSPL